ncbi:MAG: hypothetical protein N4A57_13580 [Anaeromicrobium sp.]|uniref:UDP-3-O-(3-hydroxymyristoyl)glucosamine N-acyltransferase n=1 Tax=Anaeromicrobium sp. TaxID=1929132 RepID=UPI0025D8D6BE|nr:UDP-3-O-(3-hydroxymyristoyl)glucosamine N-acyltransferase [Anaeromicrobium sp.]MCT4595275.1 hypothetical protein [Anaeromicrobium sp.]
MISKFVFNTQDLKVKGEYKDQITKNIRITNVSTNMNPKNNCLIFVNKWSNADENNLRNIINSLILLSENVRIINDKIKENNQIIYVDNPRKHYASILHYILEKNKKAKKYTQLENNITIGENVIIGQNTIVEPFVLIDHDVTIGDNCIIKSGVKIRKCTQIKNNTIIRENSVIGGDGFGVERDLDRSTIRIPHIGGVIIGNNVDIGALNTVVSGTIEPTIIEDFVMTDDHIHIGHNCKVGKSTFITACVEVSGSVVIGENCWIGPNSSIIQKVTLGKNSIVGIGTVITKSFGDNEILAGSPADNIENFKRLRKVSKKLVKDFF